MYFPVVVPQMSQLSCIVFLLCPYYCVLRHDYCALSCLNCSTTLIAVEVSPSSGTRNFGEGEPRKMKYKPLCLAAIFLNAHIRSFCPSVSRGRGGGVKIEKCSECHGKPKKCIKIFQTILPLTGGGGGGGGGGVLSSNFVHQMCHQGGGSLVPTLSTRCPTGGGGECSNFVHQMTPPGGTSGGQSWN